jgi:hypothetical protein
MALSHSPQPISTTQVPNSSLLENVGNDPKLDSRPPRGQINPAASTSTPSSLAALLADSYKQVESLRYELSVCRARAGKAERLVSSLQALHSASDPSPSNTATASVRQESAAAILMDFEKRAVQAEAARDEAEATIHTYIENWAKFDSYLVGVSDAAAEARGRYGRIFLGAEQRLLLHVPNVADNCENSHRNHMPDDSKDGKRTQIHTSVVQPIRSVPVGATTGSKLPPTPETEKPPVRKKPRVDDSIGYVDESVRCIRDILVLF